MTRLKNGGLCLTLDELRRLLEYAQARAKHSSMKESIEFVVEKGKVEIYQYCHYQECTPVWHSSYTTPEKG